MAPGSMTYLGGTLLECALTIDADERLGAALTRLTMVGMSEVGVTQTITIPRPITLEGLGTQQGFTTFPGVTLTLSGNIDSPPGNEGTLGVRGNITILTGMNTYGTLPLVCLGTAIEINSTLQGQVGT